MVMSRNQTLVQLNDRLLSALDQVVANTGRSRSDLIRDAISRYLSDVIATDDDRRLVEGYRRVPPVEDAWARASAAAMIAEEPW